VPDTTARSSESPPVRRLRARPIVEADAVAGYGALFNAGVLHHAGAYHLFVRAVRDGYRDGDGTGPRFVDYVSDIVVFTSIDGHDYEYGYVLAAAGVGGMECVEDPRVQWVHHAGDPHLVMTYTHLPMSGTGPWRIGAHRLRWSDERFELDAPSGRLLGPSDIANKDAVVFTLDDGRVALIHRIHPDMQLAIFEDLEHLWHASDEYWDAHVAELARHTLLSPSPGALGIGAGAPPVRTDAGFLLFFHERRADGAYTMNLALLDSATGQMVSRLPEPVLEPELDWERTGDVDEVVFVQGAHLDGDEIYLTYGAADRCVGAAVASVPHLLDLLAAAAEGRAA
jgi:beta-1,2-mannobiose phosphorylase / 1,2-beta-oligomannan phosphorylase